MRQFFLRLGRKFAGAVALASVLAAALSGCATTQGNVALGAVGGAAYFGGSPNNELEQIYYLGVFDEKEQLPPVFYRVRVHGQASGLSGVKFASGWVQAALVDSLGTGFAFDKDTGQLNVVKREEATALSAAPADRKLVLFGPEGFRKVPKDHRLVIVMGSSPDAFFTAMDQALGEVAQVAEDRRSLELDREVFKAVTRLAAEQGGLRQLGKDVQAELPLPGGGGQ
jgi:hypothetical protein